MVNKREKDGYEAEADSVTVPSWMDYPSKDPKVYKVTEVKAGYKVAGVKQIFNQLETAYDYIEELKGTPDLSALQDGLIFTDSNRILISFTPEDRNRLDRHAYWSFLQQNERYQADPTDFHNAYHWLNNHPAFYYRQEGRLNDWIQDQGLENLEVSVMRDEQSGETKLLLEHGGLTHPQRIGSARYADYRLDSWAPTYELAIIVLASKINHNFDVEGNDKGLSEEPPEWMKKVLKRIKDDQE